MKARVVLYKCQDILDSQGYTWTTLLVPSYRADKRFRAVLQEFKAKKVVLPKRERALLSWINSEYQENCIAHLFEDLMNDFSPSMSKNEVQTSSGKLKRKCDLQKQVLRKEKRSFWKRKSNKKTESLLSFID